LQKLAGHRQFSHMLREREVHRRADARSRRSVLPKPAD
jgi:hypothetical protein